MTSNTTALNELSREASSTASRLANLLVSREPPSPGDVEDVRQLCTQAEGSSHERYFLALAITIIHEARDHFAGLAEANAKLIALANDSLPTAAIESEQLSEPAWRLIYQSGYTLALLHHGAAKHLIVDSASSLIDAVASLSENPDESLASISLLALTSALTASHATNEHRLMLDIDTLAESAARRLPPESLATAHWWVERTLIENFDATQRRASEQRLAELLALSANAAAQTGDPIVGFKHARNRFEFARRTQDLSSQRDAITAMQAAYKRLGSRRRALGMRLLRMQALFALDDGDVTAAEHQARATINLAHTLAAQPNDLMAVWNLLGLILYASTERYGDAAAALRTAATHAVAQHRELLDAAAELLECRHLWNHDNAAALGKLRSGLSAARAVHYLNWFSLKPTIASWIAARGIEHRIEVEFCAQAIKQRGLAPPVDAPRDWPWKLRIQLLGGYALEHNADVAALPKTAEQRPHEVIQALAIAGPKGLTRAGLARALYGLNPPRDHTATNMALSRARKLVGDPSLIETDGQRTRINKNAVYVDLWALRAIAASNDDPPERRCERALALYAGPLLDGEADAARHRVAGAAARDLLVHVLEQALACLPHAATIALLIRAIEREPGDERIYQYLIELLLKSGEIGRSQEILTRSEVAIAEVRGQAPSEHFRRKMSAAIATAQREHAA